MEPLVTLRHVEKTLLSKIGSIAKNPSHDPTVMRTEIALLAQGIVELSGQCEDLEKALTIVASNVTIHAK